MLQNTPLDTVASGSESDENVDDLLTEYQRYLDKAHKQKINYHEKTKTKNKVPSVRRDRFAKTKPGMNPKYDDYYYSNGYYSPNKYPQLPLTNPLDIFIPMNSNPKLRYLTTPQPKGNHDDFSVIEKRLIELPPVFPSQNIEPIKSSCFCKNPQLPCDCKCKQCLLPFDTMSQINMQHGDSFARTPNSEYATEEHLKDSDNNLNIRIKVDIQLPKTQETIGRFFKNRSREDMGNSKESSLSLPFPYFNFPIPMDVFGYKRMSNHDSGHKLGVHKKKKARISSGSKKHRKKMVNFHNLNIQPQTSTLNVQPYVEEAFNWTDVNDRINNTNQVTINKTLLTYKLQTNVSNSDLNIVNKTTESSIAHETQTEESIFVMLNITNVGDNTTEDVHKTENSVETEFPKVDTNVPTEKLSNNRQKRDISKNNNTEKPLKKLTNHTNQKIIKKPTTHKTSPTAKSKVAYNKPSSINATRQINLFTITNEWNKKNDTKKSDKLILADAELVYWPTVFKNQTNVNSRNITTIILERENKRAKVNITKEAIRNNRTRALERAIFGDINWDDVDTVAPVFMSFVGKYLRGVLTFCSQNVCHSMKCADKTCVHRLCVPNDRWNQRGHCYGSNDTGKHISIIQTPILATKIFYTHALKYLFNLFFLLVTDSVASLESIMDLPSNVAFEIVDILQDKMLGKLFGKVTLCISSKCISFVASKKNFLKSKCSVKELKTGHCPNIKNFKIM